MAQVTEPPDDPSPKFLYIVQPTEEQLARATAEAYGLAPERAERLALASGRRLGELSSLNFGHAGADARPDWLMEQQRCAALLASSSYDLQEGEVVSEDPRAMGVTVHVHATHGLK